MKRTLRLVLITSLLSLAIASCGGQKQPDSAPSEPTLPNPCPPGRAVSDAIGAPTAPEFDRGLALTSMSTVDLSACAKKAPAGCAQVQVQFEPNGNVSSAVACDTALPPAVRACIEKRYKMISVPSFRDRAVTTRKKVCIGGARE